MKLRCRIGLHPHYTLGGRQRRFAWCTSCGRTWLSVYDGQDSHLERARGYAYGEPLRSRAPSSE